MSSPEGEFSKLNRRKQRPTHKKMTREVVKSPTVAKSQNRRLTDQDEDVETHLKKHKSRGKKTPQYRPIHFEGLRRAECEIARNVQGEAFKEKIKMLRTSMHVEI